MSIPKLGVLAVSDAESIEALTGALAAADWHAGRDYELFMPMPGSADETVAANMRQLIAAGVALVVAQTRPAGRAAVAATRDLPIVLGAYNGDPAREGIVATLEHPGGNVTGTYYAGERGARQRLELMRELAPHARTIGVLMNPRSTFSCGLAEQSAAIARGMGFTARCIGADDEAGVEAALANAARHGIEAIVTVTGADMYALREALVRAARTYRLPAIMGSIGFAELGGLAKLGPDIPVLWRRMATAHVIPILQGKAPGSLPMIGLEAFELEINLSTAADLGLGVSDALRHKATRLFE